ncbi:MAG: hypothetical protein HRT71_19665 [Flavobacteriales bacterium]|nr:hypothetical protein [Flavobacteriales bacterium]
MDKDLENIANKCYQIHQEVADSLIVQEKDCTKLETEQANISNTLNDLNGRLRVKLKANGKVSNVLINQLLRHHLQVGEKYVIKNEDTFISVVEYFHSREILDLIELIELEKCSTERKPFKNEPLKGLKHVHHGAYASRGYSAVKNCINYWYYEGKLKEKKKAELQELLDESELNITARMYSKAISTLQSEGLTGEWLIYKKHNGVTYYLCLAKHDEGDQIIYNDKIRSCLLQFPELEDNVDEETKIVESLN